MGLSRSSLSTERTNVICSIIKLMQRRLVLRVRRPAIPANARDK